MRVLDVGCGKGFLVKDLMLECPGLRRSASISRAMRCSIVPPRSSAGCISARADDLPFPDRSFDCVLSLNAIHNCRARAPSCERRSNG